MRLSAQGTAPRATASTDSPLSARPLQHYGQWWEPLHFSNECSGSHNGLHFASPRNAASSLWWHHIVRFFAYFSGPIIWALEIAAALLIVVTHSVDFVGVIIIANLVMIVVMMAFRTSLRLWRDSHPSSTIDILERRPSHHHFSLRLR